MDNNMCVPSCLLLLVCSLTNGEKWLVSWILTVSITGCCEIKKGHHKENDP